MTVRVNKQPFNLREKLSELERPIGLKGSELMRSETVQEARDFVSAGRRNIVINGDMKISQRYGFNNPQTVVNANNFYLDRFIVRNTTTGALQVRQNSPGSPFINAMQINVTSADTSIAAGEYARIQYYVEGNDMRGVDWGQSASVSPKDYLTLSFWVKTNKLGDYHVNLENTASSYYPIMVKKYTLNKSDEWQKVVVTFPPPGPYSFERGNGIGLRITWALSIGSNYTSATDGVWRTSGYQMSTSSQTNFMDSTSNYFYLTGVQLEVGRNATEFEHRPIGEELLLCQRYFYKLGGEVASPYSNGLVLPLHQSSSGYYFVSGMFPVEMRTSPTISKNFGTSDYTTSTPSSGNQWNLRDWYVTNRSLGTADFAPERYGRMWTFKLGTVSGGTTASVLYIGTNSNAHFQFNAEL